MQAACPSQPVVLTAEQFLEKVQALPLNNMTFYRSLPTLDCIREALKQAAAVESQKKPLRKDTRFSVLRDGIKQKVYIFPKKLGSLAILPLPISLNCPQGSCKYYRTIKLALSTEGELFVKTSCIPKPYVIPYEENIKIWEKFKYPGLLKLEAWTMNRDFLLSKIKTITKYYPNGDLSNFIFKQMQATEKKEKWSLFQKLLNCIRALHKEGFYHNDLKLENFLVDNQLDPLLCDFEFMGPLGNNVSKGRTGTHIYNLEERITHPESAQMWTIGCLLFTIFYGSLPWQTAKDLKELNELQKSYIENTLGMVDDRSDAVLRLLKGLWNVEPNQRWSFEKTELFVKEQIVV